MDQPPPVVAPSPRGLPIAGHAWALAGDAGSFFADTYKQLGPVFTVRAFRRRFTVLAGPEANLFLTRNGTRLLRSQEFWSGFNAEFGAARSLPSMDGAEHARLRKAQQAGYSGRFIEERLEEVIEIARREIASWPHDTPLPAVTALQQIVTEQLGTIIAGTSPCGHLDEVNTFVRTLLAAQVTRQRPGWLTKLPRFRRARRSVLELCEKVRARHAPGGASEKRGDLINDLLRLHADDPAFLPETDLTPALLGPFVAGLDTVGGTCAFMLHALLQAPELLARMQGEVDAAFAAGTPEATALRKLDVTHRVALETLRMYPIAPAIMRTVTNTFDFSGYTIAAGTQLIAATTVAHHLDECFPEPSRFDIDRYLPARREHKKPGAYAPFGIGAHTCLGAGFAQVAIAATMATLVHEVEPRPARPGYRLRIKPTPTPHPDDSFRIRVANRTPATRHRPETKPEPKSTSGR